MSAFTRPVVLAPDGSSTLLERLTLTAGADGLFSEAWLQDALFRNPKALPVSDIDPHIGPLVPLCTEMETGAGPADIVFVTATGKLVIAETKLWRNYEARREVVAQILDYAKQLTSWSYETLEQRAAIAAKAPGTNFLVNCLQTHAQDADPVAFADGVRRSLSSGDFLLLIVGDGIRYGAESLVAFLERWGNLRFRLGLVEVAAYRLPEGRTLLQPRVLAKTEILERTILIGPNGPVSYDQVAQAEDMPSATQAQREWYVRFWSEFLQRLTAIDGTFDRLTPARSTNQFFPMPPGGTLSWVSAYVSQSAKMAGVYLTFAKAYDRAADLYSALEGSREDIEKEIGVPLAWEKSGDKLYISVPDVKYLDLDSPTDRDRVLDYLARMMASMVRVLQPAMEAAVKQLA